MALKSSKWHQFKDDVDILACKILIWETGDKTKIDVSDPPADKCLTIRECESIEIVESTKKPIGTATVKFPRGTIIQRTLTKNDLEENGSTEVYTERLADGAIIEQRSGTSVAKPSDFKVGQRIRIYLTYYRDKSHSAKEYGYTQEKSPEAAHIAIEEIDKAFLNHPDFDGYITKCSVSTPIEIKCENLISALKRKNCRKITTGTHTTVQELLKKGGKYDLLKGTGIDLDADTLNVKTDVGKLQLCDSLTVADVLTEWAKYGVYTYIVYDDKGNPKLSANTPYSEKNLKKELEKSPWAVIQFDYHVANDGLTLMNTDPKFLAVSATGFKFEGTGKNQKEVKYSITVRLNPEWTGTKDTKHKKFQLLNETKLTKKSMKLGAVPKSCVKDKVDLSQYQVVPYVSRKIGITEDELIKEAEMYFENYHMNGIEGSITIFGDKFDTERGISHIAPGMKVELLDQRVPEKNGWYRVEEVQTTFGTGGFRQTLKLPYCYARPDKEEKEETK